MDCEESLEMMFVYFAKTQEKEGRGGELLSGEVLWMCVCVQNSLLCKFVSQKLQLWTVQMLTNVEASAPFFEKEKKRKKHNSCNKGAI